MKQGTEEYPTEARIDHSLHASTRTSDGVGPSAHHNVALGNIEFVKFEPQDLCTCFQLEDEAFVHSHEHQTKCCRSSQESQAGELQFHAFDEEGLFSVLSTTIEVWSTISTSQIPAKRAGRSNSR